MSSRKKGAEMEPERRLPQIGAFVRVRATIRRRMKKGQDAHASVRTLERRPTCVDGVVIGATYRWEGDVTWVDDGVRSFTPRGSPLLVLQVRRGYVNRPVECLPEDAEVVGPRELPFRHAKSTWHLPLSIEVRESLRQEMQRWPRGAGGKWIKLPRKCEACGSALRLGNVRGNGNTWEHVNVAGSPEHGYHRITPAEQNPEKSSEAIP